MGINLTIDEGWLVGARHVISPNADERPSGELVSMIVVHGISLPPGAYGGAWVDALFTNTLNEEAHPYFQSISKLRVSAHVMIDRFGKINQYVSFDRRAWHAGASCFQGRECCNDFSIGIELEGCDDDAYEVVQYEKLASIISALMITYPKISRQAVVGHCDIAPGRKTDPGPAFDWGKLNSLLEIQESSV